jgi:type I restriction enzyme S subunit
VQRGFLDLTEIKHIEATEQEIADLQLLPGDVLFTEGGDRDKLGRGWIWNGEIPRCIHQNHIFRARLRSDLIQGKFVSWFANLVGQNYFIGEGKQTVNLASINMRKLRALPVPVVPSGEQREMVRRVEALFKLANSIERRVAAATARAEKLTQSILAKAFRGELVPTEAKLARREGRPYEQGSELIARLGVRRQDGRGAKIGKRRAQDPQERIVSVR